MARMTKVKVIASLKSMVVEFDEESPYKDLVALLQEKTLDVESEPAENKRIEFSNKLPKRNTFMSDAIRDERDSEKLNAELRKREYKGKVVRTHRIKEYEVIDGFWVTNFIIEIRE